MRSSFILFFTLYFGAFMGTAQEIIGPNQPLEGPGSATYLHDSVIFQDFADKPEGYWLFEPAKPIPEKAQVVVFVHGYGAYNPMIYGKWIRHIVQKGNIVIYPRYQKNLLSPKPKKFGKNVAQAIRDALVELDTGKHVKPIVEPLILVGHSYGGVIAADLGVNFEAYKIPQPKAIMMVSPGTGPFKGGRLETYEDMPSDTKLLIVASEKDRVVGTEFAELVFQTAVHTPQRNYIQQFRDDYGNPALGAGHNQCYSLDESFDSGKRNITAKRARKKARLDAIDYLGYWKLLDALITCTQMGEDCSFAFGGTAEQKSLGYWSDGTPVKTLKITLPPERILISEEHKN